MWPQLLLYAAEVALKLHLPHLNRRLFSDAIRRMPRAYWSVRTSLLGEISTRAWFLLLEIYYLCFNYLYGEPVSPKDLSCSEPVSPKDEGMW